jgi:hypothetical protein
MHQTLECTSPFSQSPTRQIPKNGERRRGKTKNKAGHLLPQPPTLCTFHNPKENSVELVQSRKKEAESLLTPETEVPAFSETGGEC